MPLSWGRAAASVSPTWTTPDQQGEHPQAFRRYTIASSSQISIPIRTTRFVCCPTGGRREQANLLFQMQIVSPSGKRRTINYLMREIPSGWGKPSTCR